MNAPNTPPEHGTRQRYWSKRVPCRCSLCRAAWTAYCLARSYAAGRSVPIDEHLRRLAARVRHGTKTMYERRGCRCAECRAWSAAKKRAIRHRRANATRSTRGSHAR